MKCFALTLAGILIIFTRLLFSFHAFLVLWRTTDAISGFSWLGLIPLALYIIDVYYVLVKRKTKEWSGFSVSVCIYLIVVLPCFWRLRLEQLSKFRLTITGADCLNNTSSQNLNTVECEAAKVVQELESVVGLDDIKGIRVPVKLDYNTWIEALEQSMIFVLIITRWIAPFFHSSHRKLSETLFIYLGLGSDIIELFVLFEENYVISNESLCIVILTVWTLSVTQFLLPLTGALAPSNKKVKSNSCAQHCPKFLQSEAFTIAAIVMMQDFPFLLVRLYVMIAGSFVSYNLLFFTAKNILLIFLQGYRFIVVLYIEPSTDNSIPTRVEFKNEDSKDPEDHENKDAAKHTRRDNISSLNEPNDGGTLEEIIVPILDDVEVDINDKGDVSNAKD